MISRVFFNQNDSAIPSNELHRFARVRANLCHGRSPSGRGTVQVMAVGLSGRLELSHRRGRGVPGARREREARRFLPGTTNNPGSPLPPPPGAARTKTWEPNITFLEEEPDIVFSSQNRAKRCTTDDAEGILYSKTHGASLLFTLKSCSDSPANARGILNRPDNCRDVCEDRTL